MMTIKKTNLDRFDPQCYSCNMPKKSSVSKLEKMVVEEQAASLDVNPNNKQEIIAECKRQGGDLPYLIERLMAGTKATRMTIDKEGYKHTEPDHAAIHKSTLTLLEMQGYIREKITIGTQNNTLAVVEKLDIKVSDRLSEWKREYVQEAK